MMKDRKLIFSMIMAICMIIGVVAFFKLLAGWDTESMPHIIMLVAVMLLMILGYCKAHKELRRLLDDETAKMDRHEEKVNQYMELLKPSGRDAIRISFADKGTAPLPAGCSKYGGRPDVPANFQWPHDNSGRPLSLLLQIDCADLTSLDHENLLPTSGQLYFFYELSKMRRDGKKNSVRVIYNDKPSSQLHPLDYPVNLGKHYQLQECRLQFSQKTSFPCLEEVGHLTHKPFKTKYNFEFEEASDRLEEKYCPGSEGIGNMLGYAFLIKKPIVKDLSNHVLLLQLDSSEYWEEDDKTAHDLLLGDYGIIYFYIKREDLLARRFDRIKFALQSN